jgi:uncharacterized protein (DUF58 family)
VVTWRVPALLLALGAPTLVVCSVLSVSPWAPLGVVVAVVLALFLLDLLIAAPASDVTLHRSGPNQLRLGDSATVSLHITNTGVRTLRGLVRDAWVPSAGAGEPYAHSVLVDPGETTTVESVLTPTRRGDRPAARVTIRSYGLMGLAFRQTSRRRSRALTPAWVLRTLPEFKSRRLLPEKLSRLRVIDGQVVTRGRGQGTEFDSLRDYVIGDDPRSVDWRGSARRDHVVVKQWRPERDRRVLCVLDTGRTSAGRIATAAAPTTPEIGGEPRLDLAIDAALLLSTVAAHAGDRVDLLAVDTETHANLTTSNTRGLPRLQAALAPLQPALVETDFGRVASEVLALERKRALVVLFTTLDAGAVGEGLLPVLPTLVSRHRVVVAAVHDPALEAYAGGRGGVGELHVAAAAERGLAELRRVRAALVRYGVTVIDAPAETFASQVADTYLNLKAAGRL